MGSVHFNVHFSVRLIHEPCPQHGEKRSCTWEASKKKVPITDKFLDGIFLGIKEGSVEFIVGTPAGCVVCRTVKRRPREDAPDPVFVNSIRGTPRRLLPEDEPREPRHTDLLPPINTEPASHIECTSEIPSSWRDIGTLLDVLAVKQQRSRSLRVTTRNSVGHESSKPCRQMPTSVHESGKRMKECHVQCLMRKRT